MNDYESEKERWNRKALAHEGSAESLKVKDTYDAVFGQRNTLRPIYDFFDLGPKRACIILDLGCGRGWTTVLLAQKAHLVYGVDISPDSIRVLKKTAEHNSLNNILTFVENAERLPFEDESFDFVFGSAVLHHLDLEVAIPEIYRVVKKGGKAAFCEPFGHNPLMNLYRRLKDKHIERVKGIHRAVTYDDLDRFAKYFRYASFVETSFLSDKALFLQSFESLLLKKFKFTKRFASYIAILLQK